MMYLLIVPMVIAGSIEALLWKKNKHGPLDTMVVSAFWGFVLAAVVLPFTVIWNDNVFADITGMTILYTVMVNVFTMICVASWVMVLRNMPISIANPISLVRIVFLLFFSWLIFGGSISIWEIVLVAAIFILCSSLGYLQGRKSSPDSIVTACCGPLGQCGPSCTVPQECTQNFTKGIAYMILWVASLVALEMFATAAIHGGIFPPTYVFIRFGLFFVMSVPLVFIFRSEVSKNPRVMFNRWLVGIGVLWAIASTFFNTLIRTLNVGIVSAMNTATVPIVVLGGVFIFREKIRWYSYIIIFMILACVVLLSLVV